MDFTLRFADDLANGHLARCSCDKTFGRPEMYTKNIEAKVSKLEVKASEVIDIIETDFKNGETKTVVSETQSNVLRKFISTMLLRNRDLSDYFSRGDWADFDKEIRNSLRNYMLENGVEKPRDIWLQSLEAFVDVDLSASKEGWSEWLDKTASPNFVVAFRGDTQH